MIRIDDERGYMWRASSILSFPEFVGNREEMHEGAEPSSCISFHLNAARMRCAPIQFARVLGCRLCCGFGTPLIRAACRELVEK